MTCTRWRLRLDGPKVHPQVVLGCISRLTHYVLPRSTIPQSLGALPSGDNVSGERGIDLLAYNRLNYAVHLVQKPIVCSEPRLVQSYPPAVDPAPTTALTCAFTQLCTWSSLTRPPQTRLSCPRLSCSAQRARSAHTAVSSLHSTEHSYAYATRTQKAHSCKSSGSALRIPCSEHSACAHAWLGLATSLPDL